MIAIEKSFFEIRNANVWRGDVFALRDIDLLPKVIAEKAEPVDAELKAR
jgi:hypothetical protein